MDSYFYVFLLLRNVSEWGIRGRFISLQLFFEGLIGKCLIMNKLGVACVTVRTCALVGSQSIDAHTTVLTRITGTFVDIDLALFARPACGTQTKERRLLFKSLLRCLLSVNFPPFVYRPSAASGAGSQSTICRFHLQNNSPMFMNQLNSTANPILESMLPR